MALCPALFDHGRVLVRACGGGQVGFVRVDGDALDEAEERVTGALFARGRLGVRIAGPLIVSLRATFAVALRYDSYQHTVFGAPAELWSPSPSPGRSISASGCSSIDKIRPEPPLMSVQATPAPAAEAAPAFDAIFRENAPFVWRALRKLGVPEREVEDLCQEVFVVVHRKLPTFEGRSTIRTWIYSICVRTASDHRRRAHVRREEPTADVPEERHSAPQTRDLERRQARALLDAALDALDADKRAVFVLYEIEELSMNEVAGAVGCPLQTAYSRLYAAREAVAAHFATERSEA